MKISAPEPITTAHRVDGFDCGAEPLNQYLKRFALTNTAAGISRTYVTCTERVVVGYYSLAAGSVSKGESTTRVSKGIPNYPVPVALLTRLAVDTNFQQKGIGKSLLQDALLRVAAASESLGIRALLVHAKDDRAVQFYLKHGFEKSPTNPLHLMLLMKDLKASLR